MKIQHCYTTDLLGIGGTFVSDWQEHKSEYLQGIVFADQAGTLFVEQSNDGATVHYQEQFPVGIGLAGAAAFNRRLYGHWVRLRHVNGAVAQTAFSLRAHLITEA